MADMLWSLVLPGPEPGFLTSPEAAAGSSFPFAS
jgi:hypothetical protein